VTLPPRRGLNPAGKLPVLHYDIETVADSSAIACFLEDRHPDPALVDPAGNARSMGSLLEDWADEALYWMLLYVRWKFPENASRMKAVFTAMLPLPLSLVAPRLVERQILRALHAQGTGRLERDRFLAELRQPHAYDALAARQVSLGRARLGDIAVFAMFTECARRRSTTASAGWTPFPIYPLVPSASRPDPQKSDRMTPSVGRECSGRDDLDHAGSRSWCCW
jgi:glutathione S-transferase